MKYLLKRRHSWAWCVCGYPTEDMGCGGSKADDDVAQPAATQPAAQPSAGKKPVDLLKFSNSSSKPIGDEAIQPGRRVQFGIIFPEDSGIQAAHLFFDMTKPVEKLLVAAVAHAGLKLDRGKLVGSPEKLNVFTCEGETVRLDLEIDAHLGSTLHGGDTLIIEKGNRLSPDRLQEIERKGLR